MPVFPSVEWFDAVREVFNGDEVYRGAGGGTCDAEIGVVIGDKNWILVFEGFECTGAREASEDDLVDLDFYLEMEPDDWTEMVANIRDNGHADINHTLNTLDLGSDEPIHKSKTDDGYRLELFFRFNQTFQNFFDASSRVDTVFEGAPSAGS